MRTLKCETICAEFIETVRRREKIRIMIEDVLIIKADSKYSEVISNGPTILLQVSLADLHKLYGDRFVRVNRNALVSAHHMDSMLIGEGGKAFVSFKNSDQKIAVSRRTVPDIAFFIKKRDEIRAKLDAEQLNKESEVA